MTRAHKKILVLREYVELVLEAMDPFRNAKQDTHDALEHMEDFGLDPNPSSFTIDHQTDVPVQEVLNYDDYSSWGQWQPGELAQMDEDERRQELEDFRGEDWADKAERWLVEGIPAVVVVDADEVGVGDGRGRLSFAVGMNIETVPVVWLRGKQDEDE